MRLQGWKTVAAGALVCSLGWGASNGVFGADDWNGWRALDGTPVVLTTEADENAELSGELNDEVKLNDEVESNDEVKSNGGDEEKDANGGVPSGFVGSGGFAGGISSGDFDALADETAALRAELAALREETAALKVDFETAKAKEAEAAAKKADPNAPFNLRFSGRAVADATLTSADADFTDFYGETSNIWRLRDVCLTLRGSGYGNLEYKFCLAIAEKPKIYDFYLGCKDTRYFGDVRIGQFHVESGCESLELLYETSYATMDENASIFRMSRRLGVGSARRGLDDRVRLFTGAFIPKSFITETYGTYDDNPGLLLNARLSGVPIYEENEDGLLEDLLHLGGSVYWVAPGSDDSTQRFRTRGLGGSFSAPYFLDGTIPLADRSYSVSEIETAWQRKGFATTAEGFIKSVEDGGNAFGTTVGARWMLTPGCAWGYSKEAGRFLSPTIAEDARFVNAKDRVVAGNWGAWEILGKWGWTEANDLREYAGSTYGTVNRLTTGVNWYWNDKTMWTLNWERAFIDAQRGGEAVDATHDSLILQAAVKF
ncbi:MAG: hypothetical protein IJO06_09960 [Thermoguttaceae bacterium]|nr:hypothetical protein [Thermoguttaceae bacterium]